MAYEPIQNYGIVGNMRTVALVSINGSIDWFCYPRVDSPSVFGALLDDRKGGRWQIAPRERPFSSKQIYWPDTNVLVTRFLSDAGVAELHDFIPAGIAHDPEWHDQLVRRVKVVHGRITFRMTCEPAFDYGRAPHVTRLVRNGAVFESAAMALALASTVTLVVGGAAEFTLAEGESATFVLRRVGPHEGCGAPPRHDEVEGLFQSTVEFWRRWLSRCTYTGRWREMVNRSALALKLLTFEPTGAIVASPTCSLPETIGGVRNWDYRYAWLRDAAFTIYGLLRIGFSAEASAFMSWVESRCREARPGMPLQAVYGVDGRTELAVETLDHLEGYRASRPVRIGNDAYGQLQLDIYGELMDSVYLYNKHGTPISYDLWTHLRRLLGWLQENWQRADHGIWEVPGGKRDFVYSRLMCWVAFDRALRLADKRSFPADHGPWMATRDAIYEEIMARGWNPERQAFVQSYDSRALDAANLIMPLVFFASPTDPKMLKTIDVTRRRPSDGGLSTDGLVYRYDPAMGPDGLVGREGTFNMCTFWLVEAMTRAGRVDRALLDEARLTFERMLGYANHLGLYAEQTSATGEALGNFPQGFTHLALISAAYNLDRALNGPRL